MSETLTNFMSVIPSFGRSTIHGRAFSWIANDDNSGSTIAFMRRDDSEDYLISLCRFIPNGEPNYRIGVPESGS